MADSPEAGLLIVAEPPVVKPDDEMEATRLTAGGTTRLAVRYQLLPGIRGYLLRLSGLLGESADAYREALGRGRLDRPVPGRAARPAGVPKQADPQRAGADASAGSWHAGTQQVRSRVRANREAPAPVAGASRSS